MMLMPSCPRVLVDSLPLAVEGELDERQNIDLGREP